MNWAQRLLARQKLTPGLNLPKTTLDIPMPKPPSDFCYALNKLKLQEEIVRRKKWPARYYLRYELIDTQPIAYLELGFSTKLFWIPQHEDIFATDWESMTKEDYNKQFESTPIKPGDMSLIVKQYGQIPLWQN